MPAEVQEKTTEACAAAVYAGSQDIWEEAEAAAGHDAAERLKARGFPVEYQKRAAEGGRLLAAKKRVPLVWEVFARPGRWRGRWEMAPAFPDGRLSAADRATAVAAGALVVAPGDTEADIADRLADLLTTPPGSV